MVTKEEMDARFGNVEPSTCKISITIVSKYMAYVPVELRMDHLTLDYYYEIDCNAMMKSDITEELLDEMQKYGWGYTEDGLKLRLNIKA